MPFNFLTPWAVAHLDQYRSWPCRHNSIYVNTRGLDHLHKSQKKVLCDEEFVITVLKEPKERALMNMENKLSAEVQLAVTTCTASSLFKENIFLQDCFLTERCGHDPPIGAFDCVLRIAKPSIVVATRSNEHLSKLTYVPSVPLLYGTMVQP